MFRIFRIFILALAILAISAQTHVPLQAQENWREKISAGVWQDIARQASADVVVLLTEQANLKAARLALPPGLEQNPPSLQQRNDRAWQRLWGLQEVQQRAQQPLQKFLQAQNIQWRSFWVVNSLALTVDASLLESLARRPDVAKIESDHPFNALLGESKSVTVAPLQVGVEWNISRINADDMWALGLTGTDIVVASADTGAMWTHAALQAKYLGWDGVSVNHDYAWHDAVTEDYSGNGSNPCGFASLTPCDDHSHGSHTIGTMLGDDGINQIGVAPGARWIACRNMDEGYGRLSAYLDCLQFFFAPTKIDGTGADPNLRPHVVNNSYACTVSEGCAFDSMEVAIENLRTAGIAFVAAAGNSGSLGCYSISSPPATSPYAFSIGATAYNSDLIASFSSRGPVNDGTNTYLKPDMVAPGQSVRSANNSGGFTTLSGTSMAAPHVAGAIALLWSAHPWLMRNVALTEQYLRVTARPLTSGITCGSYPGSQVPNAVFGYGALDVLATNTYLNGMHIYYFPVMLVAP